MKRLLSLAQYMKQGIVKRIQPDKSKMKQMRTMAHLREDFLEEHVDDKFIVLHLEAYHDIIAELITAHLYKEGLDCRTGDSLLAYAFLRFPSCAQHKDLLMQLFTMRHTIHSLKPQHVKKFLEKNHNILYEIIDELKY